MVEVGALDCCIPAKHDMQVTAEPRGDWLKKLFCEKNPDLVLLDIMLPGARTA